MQKHKTRKVLKLLWGPLLWYRSCHKIYKYFYVCFYMQSCLIYILIDTDIDYWYREHERSLPLPFLFLASSPVTGGKHFNSLLLAPLTQWSTAGSESEARRDKATIYISCVKLINAECTIGLIFKTSLWLKHVLPCSLVYYSCLACFKKYFTEIL